MAQQYESLSPNGHKNLVTAIFEKLKGLLDKKVDKVTGKGLSTNDYTTTEKTKLSGIAIGAEVNQNAFSNVKVGTTTVSADSKTDTLELSGGTNITITPDATNDKVTITHSNSGVTAGTYKSVTVNATGHVTGGTNPSTLSGYGITDAKIANGTITLGSNTITPLTSHQAVTDNNPTLAWGAKSKVATIGDTEINVTMPSNPNTDTKVTSVGNHYTPAENTASQLDADASSTTAATWNSTSLVTGVTIKRDAKGHVVGLAVDSIKMPANPNSNTTYTLSADTTNNKITLTPSSGTAQSITVPYATSAGSATKATQDGSGNVITSTYVKKTGDTMTGDLILYKEGMTTNNHPSSLIFSNKDTTTGQTYSNAYIKVYQDHGSTTYGTNMVIHTGGGLFLGSGESPASHYSAKGASYSGEDTFLTADGTAHLQANGNTIANRVGVQITTGHALVPEKADVATNNIGSIGTSSYKWANGYFTNINGVAVGDSPKFTDTTYTFTNKNATLAWSTTSTIATVDGVDIKVTMPANPNTNTDTLVTQTNTTTNADYRVLFSENANDTTETKTARKSTNLKYNPSTGNLQTTQLNGVAVGSSPKFTDTNTHRPIQMNDTEILGNNTTVLNLKAGSNITLSHSSGTVTIAATNTTYSVVSKTANGLCPQLPNETTTTKYLRQDGTWVAPPNTNTHRPIQVDGTEILGNNTTALNLKAGNNVTITNDGGTVTIASSYTNTDVNVKVNNTNPTTGTWYYPVWYTATSGTGNVNANDGFRYHSLQGTASAVGTAYLQLGNGTASGTAGNKKGILRLYAEKAGHADIVYTASATGNTTHTLPTTGGTILNTGTTSFTQALTSGTEIGTIKINGTSTKIYCQTNTNTHRPIQVNGTEILGNNTTVLNLKAGSNITLTNSSGTVTIAGTANNAVTQTSSSTSGRILVGNNDDDDTRTEDTRKISTLRYESDDTANQISVINYMGTQEYKASHRVETNGMYELRIAAKLGESTAATTNSIFTAKYDGTMNILHTLKVDGITTMHSLELSDTTPFIDFHHNKSTLDYTSRIITSNLAELTFYGKNSSGTTVHGTCRGAAFIVVSSKYMKENIKDIEDDEAMKLLQLRPVSFDYKYTGETNKRGLIAEEVMEVMPEMVYVPEEYSEPMDDSIPDNVPSIDYSKFVPYLIKMVQIQQKEIDELKEIMKG